MINGHLSLGITLNQLSQLKLPAVHPAQDNPKYKLGSCVIVGHGALAKRQESTHLLWQEQGVKIVFADAHGPSLDDAIEGPGRFLLDRDDAEIRRFASKQKGGMVDLLLVNNAPQDHLATALRYGDFARKVIIQKPQDLNYPLIQTIAEGALYKGLLEKTFIHDHYRNKGVVPTLFKYLPEKMQSHGKITRMMFFITESKSVLDEKARSNALGCGMIQDLGVHMFDLFLETLIYCNEWKCDPNDDRMARRVGGHIDLMSVAKQVQQNTPFSGGVETFAAIDLRVTEQIAMPIRPGQSDISDVPVHDNSFDVLFVLGKGVVPTQGVAKDVKAIVIEHERKGSPTIIDLASLGTIGIPNDDINTHHGGMNRPLMLLATNPPDHAMERLGGHEYAQWQSFALGMRVAKIANSASSIQPGRMSAYINQRPIPDLLHDMVNEGELRSTWSDIRSLQQYSAASIKDSTFFD